MARIALVVTNACAPDPRVERHARWLSEIGHDVEIHAWDRQQNHLVLEEKNGYTIHRYQIGETNYKSAFKTWQTKKKFISSLKLDHDLLILNDTDTFGVNYSGLTVLDIHDMAHTWPLMRGKSLLHKLASYRMYLQAKKMIKNANEIIVAAPGFQTFVKQFGKESYVVMNRSNPKKIERTRDKVVGYIGRIREIESISMMIKSAEKIGFKVLIAGDGIHAKIVEEKFPDIDYRGPFTEDQISNLISEISVMYAMYDSGRPNIKSGAIPTKMLDAAAHGIPSVVSKNTPMGNLCDEEGLGTTANYGDIEEISKAILKAYKMEIKPPRGWDKKEFLSVIKRLID